MTCLEAFVIRQCIIQRQKLQSQMLSQSNWRSNLEMEILMGFRAQMMMKGSINRNSHQSMMVNTDTSIIIFNDN